MDELHQYLRIWISFLKIETVLLVSGMLWLVSHVVDDNSVFDRDRETFEPNDFTSNLYFTMVMKIPISCRLPISLKKSHSSGVMM